MAVRAFLTSWGMIAGGITLVLAGCSTKKNDVPNDGVATAIAKARAMTPAAAEQFANETTDLEYPIYRSLMKAGHLDEELGGPVAAEAALRGLMGDFRKAALGLRADLPRALKVGGLEAEHGYGLTGLGYSAYGSLLLGLLAGTVQKTGTFQSDGKDGSFKADLKENSVDVDIGYEGKFGELEGKLRTSVAFDKCPDKDGRVHVKFTSKTSLLKSGSRSGANSEIKAEGHIFFDDDAKFASSEIDLHVEHAAFNGKGQGVFVDASYTASTSDPDANSAKINRQSSQATVDDQKVAAAQATVANLIAQIVGVLGSANVGEGKCVTLNPTSTPSKRSGVKPGTAFEILAAPRSKLDGTPTGGTVKATLTGGSSLDPADTKIKADAKFAYVAPGEKNKKASIDFEARSKRGVGKATLDFDTNNRAYTAVGGADAYRGTGTICSFSAPFTISGSGVTNTFTPTSETGGTYSYTGNMSGFSVFGQGTYTVSADENGGTLTATGPGSVKTPMGVKTRKGTEVYKLTPAEPCG